MEPVTPPCESLNLGEICVEPLPSCANSPVVPILKRAFGGVSLDAAVEWAWGPAGLTVDEERFAKEPLLVAWSLVACWAALGLPSAMGPVVAAPSFLLLPLLSSELKPTSTNAPSGRPCVFLSSRSWVSLTEGLPLRDLLADSFRGPVWGDRAER
jgi:hypothetical protein